MSETILAEQVPPNPAAVPPVAVPPEGGFTTPEWAKGIELEPELLGDPSLKAIKDIPTLIKSYVHAQKKMGADKVIIPTANSTQEEWDGFYAKLGMPLKAEEYAPKFPEKPVFKDDLMEKFKAEAYKNKLLPNQASAMFEFLNTYTSEQAENVQKQSQENIDTEINGLKTEWGESFDMKLRQAKMAVAEFGGEDIKTYLNETGLGNDPKLIKLFQKIGENYFKEDSFTAESKPAYSMSPDEAQSQINKIMGDGTSPYFNKNHPDHTRMVGEVNKLFQMTSGKK